MSKLVAITALVFLLFLTGCPDSTPEMTIEKSDTRYEKPPSSNQVIKGEDVAFELWYDETQWKIYTPQNPTGKTADKEKKKSNILLANTSRDVYASIHETYDVMTHGESYQHYAKWIKRQGGRIIAEDIRSVNGSDILFIKSRVEADSKPYISINYVLTNKSGGVSVTAGVAEDLFDTHERAISNLLNGLVDPNR